MPPAARTNSSTAASTGIQGHPALVVPRSTSEFHAMIEAARKHHRAMGGQLADVATELRGLLPRVIQSRIPGGIDARIIARRIVKPLFDAAAEEDEVAKLLIVSYQRYTDYVVNARKNNAGQPFKVDG